MELMVFQFVLALKQLKPAKPNDNLPDLVIFALIIYQTLLAGYCSAEIMSVPSGSDSTLPFWWCAGAFLGWTSLVGFVTWVVVGKMYDD
jgi:hypothetical protein